MGERAVADEVQPGVYYVHTGGRRMLCVDIETWLGEGRPRWTPGRHSEVLAESVLRLPGSVARMRLQAYVGDRGD